jgi:hypothetical protein
MKCSLNTIATLISSAIAALVAAIVLAYFWVTAIPLFAAAALVATVSVGLIPAIKNALLAYAACRGPSATCTMSFTINYLSQAAAIISFVAFTVAAVLQITALAFLFSWFLSWLFPSTEAAVSVLVQSGLYGCAITAIILLGVLTNAWGYKSCMDKQDASSGSPTRVSQNLNRIN